MIKLIFMLADDTSLSGFIVLLIFVYQHV